MTAPPSHDNHSLVGSALRLLAVGLAPYVTAKITEAETSGRCTIDDRVALMEVEGDVAVSLRLITTYWNEAFRDYLGAVERTLVAEIREVRSKWAHQEPFNDDDLDRALDSMGRLLNSVEAVDQAERVNEAKHRLRLRRYGAQSTAEDAPPEPAAPARTPAPPARPPLPPLPVGVPDERAQSHVWRADVADQDARRLAPRTGGQPTPMADALERERRVQNHIGLGIAFRRQEKFGPAMAEFEQVIGTDPDLADGWFHRGMTWGLMGDHRRAIADFDRAVALAPNHARAFNCRGYARFCLGDLQQALEDLEHASRLDPDDDLTRSNLEQVRIKYLRQPGDSESSRRGTGFNF